MFSKSTYFVLSTLAFVVLGAPNPGHRGGDDIIDSCNAGPVQCCNTVHQSNDQVANFLAGLIGIGVGDVTGQVGLNCNPITLIGAGFGTNCNSQPVCCSGNHFDGLINIGCSPINVGL